MGSAKVERNLQGWPCPRNVTVFTGYLSSVVVLWLEKGFFFFFFGMFVSLFPSLSIISNAMYCILVFCLFYFLLLLFLGGFLKAFGLNNEEDLWNLTTDYFLHDLLKLTYLVICHYLLRSKKKKENWIRLTKIYFHLELQLQISCPIFCNVCAYICLHPVGDKVYLNPTINFLFSFQSQMYPLSRT